jgi:hypothetical protein
MTNTTKKILVKSLGIAILILISCQTFSFKGEEWIQGDYTYYLINPDTILDDIASGNTNTFSQQAITPQPPLSQSLSTVLWTQKDYLSIVEALHEYVWNESTEGWSLRYLYFSVSCEDINKGPQFAHFILYKVIEKDQQKIRLEHRIYIDPSNNSVSWSEDEFRPSLVTLRPTELSKQKTSITDVFQIAEKNGGQAARTEADNKCKVSGVLVQSSDNWRVSYTKTLDLFKIDINAFDGKYKILNVK